MPRYTPVVFEMHATPSTVGNAEQAARSVSDRGRFNPPIVLTTAQFNPSVDVRRLERVPDPEFCLFCAACAAFGIDLAIMP